MLKMLRLTLEDLIKFFTYIVKSYQPLNRYWDYENLFQSIMLKTS